MINALHLVTPFFAGIDTRAQLSISERSTQNTIHPRFGERNSGIPQSTGNQTTKMMADPDLLQKRSDISVLLPENGGELEQRMPTVGPWRNRRCSWALD